MREIVSNVIRHSGASRFVASATLTPGHLSLRFTDNGKGMPPEALAGETSGFGLRNLRHRIADIGGRLSLAATPSGSTITLDIPLVLTPHTPEPGVLEPLVALNSQA
ncbi:Redox sensor histidine kinase response regulator DevS [compost metagenome]